MSNKKKIFNLEEAKSLYFDNMWSAKEIASYYGYSTHKSILDKLKKAGCVMRKGQNQNSNIRTMPYSDIFKDIDSDNKGYMLGLFLSDSIVYEDKIDYLCFDIEIANYIKKYTNVDFSIIDSKDICKNIPLSRNLKPLCYLFSFYDNTFIENFKRFSPQYMEVFKCNLNASEYKYISSILRGIFDGAGTFGFPSNNPGSIYFKLESSNKGYIDFSVHLLNILGMRNISTNINSYNKHQITSGQNSNIEILLNSIYFSDFECDFKKKRLLKHYNIRKSLKYEDN